MGILRTLHTTQHPAKYLHVTEMKHGFIVRNFRMWWINKVDKYSSLTTAALLGGPARRMAVRGHHNHVAHGQTLQTVFNPCIRRNVGSRQGHIQ
jgi:hypothetical protein